VSCPDENGGREQCISERDRRTRPSRNALLVVRLKCDLRGESSPPKTISGANRGQRHQADDRHFVVKSEYIRRRNDSIPRCEGVRELKEHPPASENHKSRLEYVPYGRVTRWKAAGDHSFRDHFNTVRQTASLSQASHREPLFTSSDGTGRGGIPGVIVSFLELGGCTTRKRYWS